MASGVRAWPLNARRWAWPAFCLLLAALSAALWGTDPAHLQRWDWQPGLVSAQPWRCFSAAGVHLSALHLGANLAGLLLVALLGWRAGCGPGATAAWALAWPLTQAGLALQPALLHYGGLSGVLHAGVAVACCQLLRQGPGPRRIAWALLVGLAAKVVLEQPAQGVTTQPAGWDIPIAPLAHATGAVAGLLCGLALLLRRGR